MGRRARIAIVDDERDLADAYREYLEDLGHEAVTADSAEALDVLLEEAPLDLIVLDLNMPGERGLDVLRRLRGQGDATPILIMTADADLMERVVGLELGADDFVVKPVELQELAARIAGLLQRFLRLEREVVTFERVTADLTASRLLRLGRPPERLAPGEVVLIRTLARHPNRILTRDDLIRMAAAESRDAYDRAIDARIARLRQKLETEAIVTVRGRGYMFVPPGRPSAEEPSP